MSTGDGRRTASGTFWGTAETTVNFSSFSDSIVFSSDLDAVRSAFQLSFYNCGFEQLLDYVDYGEYYTAINKDDSALTNVNLNKSLWFNLRPQITADTETAIIYATFGTNIAYLLDGLEPTDFEEDD